MEHEQAPKISYHSWLLASPCLNCGEKLNGNKIILDRKRGYTCNQCGFAHFTSGYTTNFSTCDCAQCLEDEENDNDGGGAAIDFTYTYICFSCNVDIQYGHEITTNSLNEPVCPKCSKVIYLYKDNRNTPYDDDN
tara:strand:- start:498 stop:902 length:405 start_codon:yes stop_codon:yes gene_type:complete